MTQALATRYYVTRDAENEFPELNGNAGSIISQDPHDDAHYTVCVWGNGSALEQTLNEASSVIRFTELGSVVADLDAIQAAIADDSYRAYVLNTIEAAKGVVDITADVVADQKAEVA